MGEPWYMNPVVIGAGVVLLVLLVALASRGPSTPPSSSDPFEDE